MVLPKKPRIQRRDLELAAFVGARMRDIRLARGLSLAQLHKRGAPTPSQMSSIERGKINFTTDTLIAIANALEVWPWQFFAEDDELAFMTPAEAKRALFIVIGFPKEGER